MKWYFYFPLLCAILGGVSLVAEAAQVIRGPTDREFTVESLPDGNYRLCSDGFAGAKAHHAPADIQRVSGVCFRFRKQGEEIVGEYYYPYEGSQICLNGEVNRNTVTGQAVEKMKTTPDLPKGRHNWRQEGFLQVGRPNLQATWSEATYVRYRSAILNLNQFYQFNAGTVLPPQNCAISLQENGQIPDASAVDYQQYQNDRFNYSVQYPANLLTPQKEPTNGEGQTFQSPDGKIVMQVYARQNTLSQSLPERYRQVLQNRSDAAPNATITDQTIRDNFFVVTGYRGNWVFYQKTILHNDRFKTLEFSYHRSFQPQFDAIVTEVAHSFQSTNNS
jgi:hypothetical protein